MNLTSYLWVWEQNCFEFPNTSILKWSSVSDYVMAFTSRWRSYSPPLIPFSSQSPPLLFPNTAFPSPPPALIHLQRLLLRRWPGRWSTKWRCSATSGSTTTTGFGAILVQIPKFFPTFGKRTPTPISSCPVPFSFFILLCCYTDVWKFNCFYSSSSFAQWGIQLRIDISFLHLKKKVVERINCSDFGQTNTTFQKSLPPFVRKVLLHSWIRYYVSLNSDVLWTHTGSFWFKLQS